MMMLNTKKQLYAFPLKLMALLLIVVVSYGAFARQASAEQFTQRRLELSSYDVGAVNVEHTAIFTINSTDSVGSIVFEYCGNSPLLETVCNVPAGLDTSGAALIGQTGEVGFSVHPNTALNSNRIVLTRLASAVTPQQVSYSLNNITNPSAEQTYFLRVTTHATNDGSGAYTDRGGMAFHTSEDYAVQLYVPPWLEFCVGVTISGDCNTASGNFLDLGDFSPDTVSSASSQFRANTNADNGYNISVFGTTLTSGNNLIDAIDTQSGSLPGVNQFGMNLVNNSVPNVGQNPAGPGSATLDSDYDKFNLFLFRSGDTIATTNGTSDNVTFTASYIVNISDEQAPGIYNTSVSYVCLATY